MSEQIQEKQKTDSPAHLDWRVLLGISLTAVWIFLGLVYLIGIVGMVNFVSLPTGDIGSFLEGAFAPLAFLWLVIGHFMQQTEISANTKAMQKQELSAQRQELNSRRNSYFKLLELVQQQLGSIAAFHYISVYGATGSEEVSSEEYAQMRSEAVNDPALFIRKMISAIAGHAEEPERINEILFGTDIRTRHSKNFEEIFDKILKNAKSLDQDDLFSNALLFGSPAGMFYRLIRTVQGKEQRHPLTGFTTTQHQ